MRRRRPGQPPMTRLELLEMEISHLRRVLTERLPKNRKDLESRLRELQAEAMTLRNSAPKEGAE